MVSCALHRRDRKSALWYFIGILLVAQNCIVKCCICNTLSAAVWINLRNEGTKRKHIKNHLIRWRCALSAASAYVGINTHHHHYCRWCAVGNTKLRYWLEDIRFRWCIVYFTTKTCIVYYLYCILLYLLLFILTMPVSSPTTHAVVC